MKLAYVTSSFPYGGFGIFFEPEVRAIERSGHDVVVLPVWARGSCDVADFRVVDLTPWRRAAITATARGFHRLPSAVRATYRRSRIRVTAKNLSATTSAVALARLVEREGIDHIHATWATVPATVAMATSEMTGCPWSFTAHRWDLLEDNRLAEKLHRADAVRFISGSGLEAAESMTGLKRTDRWFVGHLGVALGPTALDRPVSVTQPGYTIAVVGALVARKRHVDLLEALARLPAMDRPRLVVVGDGPERAFLERRSRLLGLGDLVEFLGQQSHDHVLDLYRSGEVHAAALASSSEGIPVSLMEAMARGLPVIATRCGGVEELVSERCGVLCDIGDVRALADAMRSLASAEHRMDLGSAARDAVATGFSATATAFELMSRLEDASPPRSTR